MILLVHGGLGQSLNPIKLRLANNWEAPTEAQLVVTRETLSFINRDFPSSLAAPGPVSTTPHRVWVPPRPWSRREGRGGLAHREVGEDGEGAAQEADEIHQVVAGPAARLQRHPVVVCQLQELVDLLVEVGVDLLLGGVPGVLGTRPGMG